MRIAITGGTGFVGRHLARRLAADGVDVVIVSRGVDARDTVIRQAPRITFVAAGVDDADALSSAFAGCGAVAHCAGINREIGRQTYARVHIGGTRAVVEAARRAGVKKIALLSFLRARPDCGSAYHESKFAAEEIVRESGLDFTILKSGMIYGRGDHMLDHLSRSLMTLPLFLKVGMRETPIRPVAVDSKEDARSPGAAGGDTAPGHEGLPPQLRRVPRQVRGAQPLGHDQLLPACPAVRGRGLGARAGRDVRGPVGNDLRSPVFVDRLISALGE